MRLVCAAHFLQWRLAVEQLVKLIVVDCETSAELLYMLLFQSNRRAHEGALYAVLILGWLANLLHLVWFRVTHFLLRESLGGHFARLLEVEKARIELC